MVTAFVKISFNRRIQNYYINLISYMQKGYFRNFIKIESTFSSNKIKDISTADKRIREMVNQKIEMKKKLQVIGMLSLIHENYDYIDINSNTILQLHRDLYKYTGCGYCGKFKNYIEETDRRHLKIRRIYGKI